ncbi:MAG TPA: metallophosphoesterase [Vicinamibacterales bacterium]|nr:metallophosphoesterase [Vicinamibacterales bacterium]
MRRYLVALTIGIAACGAEITSPSTPDIDDVAVLVGAADIAVCGAGGSMETGRMLDTQQGTVFVAGDIAYTEGTAEQFRACYDPVWGRHKARTRPAPGNHEYGSAGAAPYFAYFGSNAGPSGLGYYRYHKGSWLVFSLNSNIEGAERMAQLEWLRRELATQSDCTVAYFHHPLFSSGPHGTVPPMPVVADFWRELYAAGADVVITGHEHFYERFAPQNPDGASDPRFGLRQFIVGTGGAPMTQPVRRAPNSEAVVLTFGLLRLTLEAQSYRWDFLSVDGGAIRDSGTGNCHGKP